MRSCAGTSRGLLHLYTLCSHSERLVRVKAAIASPLGDARFQASNMQSPLCRHNSSQGKAPLACLAAFKAHSGLQRNVRSHSHSSGFPSHQSRHRARGTYRKCFSVTAQQTQSTLTKAEQSQHVYTASLRTSEARKAIRFSQAKDGRIVIDAVAIGSEAQEVSLSEALQ